ncbi:NADP-dependent oxidoreductase [Actinoplanes sp. TBRC 11911]|uniref:NADP-dependent oxidoreductase n=1 Tax=Actinoplanes sp. TBRC 11911 TaxID=2729386 RepID=UPI00145CBA3D|nr:NADP-dependent oxidoreductase [Actinoplanes sp. TBRC 11911]NMO49757.1 NADP-dependent oxidoreductase [Actinoplanes sp. TBRC 11911]
MRAAGIAEPSGEVRPLDLPRPPAPAHDEVLIDVRAAGVASWDDIMRVEDWASGLELPHALGVEAAGVVAATGSDDFMVGDAVMTFVYPLRRGACWAEQVLAPVTAVAIRPEELDEAAAGAFPVPALTAYQVLHDVLRLDSGERLLVHGAGGVTGSLIVQLALLVGAEVVATAGPRGLERLAGHGKVRLVDRTRDGWQREVGQGLDAAVNAAPDGIDFAMSVVRDGGRLASITDSTLPEARDIETHYHVVRPDGAQLALLGSMTGDGGVRFPPVRTFPLTEANAALQLATQGAGGDAVVLLP